MFVQSVWSAMWIFGCFAASLNEFEYENDDNEISLDQQTKSPSTGECLDAAPRWDKLFVALEDSHMRQNMLLSSVEQNCGGGVKMLWDKLTKGGCHLCAANLEKICQTQAEQIEWKIHQELLDIVNYNTEMERVLNLTLQQILHQSQQTNARLKRLEDGAKISPHPTSLSGLKEQEAGGLKEQEVKKLDKGSNLVTIATELQRIKLQLYEVIEETRRKDKGDT